MANDKSTRILRIDDTVKWNDLNNCSICLMELWDYITDDSKDEKMLMYKMFKV